MIELRPAKYDDEDYDDCGNTTKVILKVGKIKIPLCDECIDDLRNSLNTFNEIVFCYKCRHFEMSKWGWNYGGRCCLKSKEIDKSCMDTCPDSELKTQI